MHITFNSPIDKTGPVCPEQMFQNVPVIVSDQDIIGHAVVLTEQARSLCTLLAIDGESGGSSFQANHQIVLASLNAITGILDKLDAVLSHNATVQESLNAKGGS